jgi:hypothetical protein
VERSGDCRLRRHQLRDDHSGPGDPRLSDLRTGIQNRRPRGKAKRETKAMTTLTTFLQWSAVAVALYAGVAFLTAGQATTGLFG